MKRDELGDLMAFLHVAELRSFTRAAAQLGTSQSALSSVVRRLEERLGVRLLTRTTRSVTPTEAGERLVSTLRPAFDNIESQLSELDEFRKHPSGRIRISLGKSSASSLVFPVARQLMAEFPDLTIELTIDQKLVDIVRDGYDAGVRLGEQVDKDMVAVRIAPDMPMVVAGTADYFRTHGKPLTPHDLTGHNCINLRLPTFGGLYAWEFEKNGRPLNVRVEGQFTCNDVDLIMQAALHGRGLACLPADHLGPLVADGRLVQVLEDWCPPFPGYHLYYPSRRQLSPAFRLLVERLRYRG